MNLSHAALVRAAVADAQTRLSPSLENKAAGTDLGERLTLLSARLGSGDVTGSLGALAAARRAVAESRGQLTRYPADAADLAAIDLTLDQAAIALGAF
jgi:hypothetical protein